MSYFACEKFLGMTPMERCKVLDKKGFCKRCLSPGAAKGHKFCPDKFMCMCPGHDPGIRGYHVLVCDKHKNDPENDKLLKEFKENYLQKFGDSLPDNFKNVKISMHSMAHTASTVEEAERGIFMLQTIDIDGENFNIFYDSGCSDLICKKSAIEKLARVGRAQQIEQGPINIAGVGDNKTVSQDGIYAVTLPLGMGVEAKMNRLCLDQVTGKFPTFSLKKWRRILGIITKYLVMTLRNCPDYRVW